MYTEKDFVRIAKRENNKKRNYLVVNPLQGKHIPVSPSRALAVFDRLAEELNIYKDEQVLVVGFAETATAIGAELAIKLGAAYIQTTRENIPGAEYLYFSEEHSHATEQRLVREDLDAAAGSIDRIIFAEDEVTTGKTILNIIAILEQRYGTHIRFSVASILNGMSKEAWKTYEERKIAVHYLVKTEHDAYPAAAETTKNNGIYHELSEAQTDNTYADVINVKGWMNTRHLTDSNVYEHACQELYHEIKNRIDRKACGNFLILGTEEFMFPGLYVGKCFEEEGFSVKFHATTRSPIIVSSEETYPLHERYSLKSLYDDNRNTFLYDIEAYDTAIVITDAVRISQQGWQSLRNAITTKNQDVFLFRWC